MKVLSIRPLPDSDGIMHLYNDDGTLFGFCFEPKPEYRRAMEAWFAPPQPTPSQLQWGQHFTYNSPLTAKMVQATLAGLRCE